MRIRWVLLIVVAGIISIVALCEIDPLVHSQLAPPSQMTTLRECQQFLPHPTAIVKISVDAADYFVVYGEQPWINLAENPAAYLFSSVGEFVDWSPDASDTDRLARFWDLARLEWSAGRTLSYGDISVVANKTGEKKTEQY